jgi:hypothetical protein
MPPKKSAAAAKVTKVDNATNPKGKAKEKVGFDTKAEFKETAEVQTPADIFPTFTIDAPAGAVKGGLNIIRPLGNGKYEIVNLDSISQNVLGSEEAAEFIKSDPARLAAMKIAKKDWDSAMLKCDIAVRITGKSLLVV